MSNTVRLLGIGLVILLLGINIPVSVAALSTLDDIDAPSFVWDKAPKIFNNALQSQQWDGIAYIVLFVLFILLLFTWLETIS